VTSSSIYPLPHDTPTSRGWLQKMSRRAFALCGPRRVPQNWMLTEWPRRGLLQTCTERVGVRVQNAVPSKEQERCCTENTAACSRGSPFKLWAIRNWFQARWFCASARRTVTCNRKPIASRNIQNSREVWLFWCISAGLLTERRRQCNWDGNHRLLPQARAMSASSGRTTGWMAKPKRWR